MTRKQFGIIFTLMALIVCVGVLSMKLNQNGLTDPTDISQVISQKENMSTQEYFLKLRTEKEQSDAKLIQDLTTVKDDANTSQEQKDIANNSLIQKAQQKDQEGRVETNIRSKGYDDALCMIDQGKVQVYVKIGDNYTTTDAALIQQMVQDVTTLSDITIEAKK